MQRLNLFAIANKPVTIVTLPCLPSIVDLHQLNEDAQLMTREEWERVDTAIAQLEREKKAQGEISPRGEKTILYSKKELSEAIQRAFDDQRCEGFDYSIVVLSQLNHQTQSLKSYHYAIYTKKLDQGAFGKIEVAQARPEQHDPDYPHWWVLKKQLVDMDGRSVTLAEATTEQAIAISVGRSPRAATRMRRSRSKLGNQVPFLMELAPGCSIEKLLKREYAWQYHTQSLQPLIPALVRLELTIQMLREVIKLHQKNYVHGDLKAANFVVDLANKSVRLVDYGTARSMDQDKQVRLDRPIGTSINLTLKLRARLAEWLNKETIDFCLNEATDAYAFGITMADLWHLLETIDDSVRYDVRLWENSSYVAANKNISNIDEQDDLFVFNETADKVTLASILEIIHHLIEPEENLRWNLQEALDAVEALKASCVERISADGLYSPIKVEAVDVGRYLQSDAAGKEKLYTELSQRCHEIIFFDLNKKIRSLNEYYAVLRAFTHVDFEQDAEGNYSLKRRGFTVHDKVFVGLDGDSICSEIKMYLEKMNIPLVLTNPEVFGALHEQPEAELSSRMLLRKTI